MQSKSDRGAVLRALRKEAGVSQFRVAAATGIDPKTIYRLEAGTAATISRKSADALAKFYSEALGRTIQPADLGYQIGRLKKESNHGDEHER